MTQKPFDIHFTQTLAGTQIIMVTPPEVRIANYEYSDAWYSTHMAEAWKLTGFPEHLFHGEVRNLQKGGLQEVLSFLREKGLHITYTETTNKATHESAIVIGINKKDKVVITVNLGNNRLWYRFFAKNQETNNYYRNLFSEYFKQKVDPKTKCRFTFWQLDEDGCQAQYSTLECPNFDDIKSNYEKSTIDEIARFLEMDKPYQKGKIILWHGPPGNGKTFLIRAVAKYLSNKFKLLPEVIIDPQDLFTYPKYLTSLLLRRSAKRKQPFRFFIAEDCAQLFSTQGRDQAGFDRLLNTTDGLLGQGQKLIYLFTANEKIEDIDPAILRPGRCLQNVLIDNWNRNRALGWLETHGLLEKYRDNVGQSISLAELYAMHNGIIPAKQYQNDGFGFSLKSPGD